ncbi:MAG: M1 family metallopeptidase [Anaerolineae bacterium]|nr:M1 family metallopeptidase [Anaerolineae bacterium]
MKKQTRIALAVVIALALFTGCRSTQTTPAPIQVSTPAEPTTEPEPTQPIETFTEAPTQAAPPLNEIDWDDRELFRSGLIPEAQGALDALPGASVYHIDLTLPADFETLPGHQAVRYTNQEDVALEEIYFQLFPNRAGGSLDVTRVTVDGAEVAASLVFQDSVLAVPLPAPLAPGAQTVIEMDYQIGVAHEMGGNYGLFGYFEEVLVLDEFYPVIPVYDDEGWNVQDPVLVGDVTYFDASFYVVRVTGPAGLVFVTSGVEVGREETGDDQVVTFAAGPARTFYLAASEHFSAVSQQVGETTVNSYAFPDDTAGAYLVLNTCVAALESFNARFGTYPYTEFDAASTPMLALGIEYPGMTGLTTAAYDPGATIAGLPAHAILESATAHEVAHQWFYNAVGNDQVDEPWLDEALAQYLTALYFTDTYGQGAEQGYIDSWYGRWDRIERAEIPVGLSCTVYDDANYSPIVYGRGPLFVLALAEEMGQETFDAFLRDYYQSNLWGIGTGEGFRALAEQHCACDLSEVFAEWVYAAE